MRNKLETLCLHADSISESSAACLPVTPPLCLSTTFHRSSAQQEPEFVYSRDGQPNFARLETILGAVENGIELSIISLILC